MKKEFVMGIDVGTGSARAGIFDLKGKMQGHASVPIEMWRPAEDFAEQSSEDIWRSVSRAVRQALKNGNIHRKYVTGISFDATCSLVALDSSDRPLTVSPSGKREQNIIVWMDHRAKDETALINSLHHPVLKYVGKKMSVEQEPPKLLWIKNNLRDTWKKAHKYFDLADYLTYRASGQDVRSLCTVVCKWGYLGHKGSFGNWDRSFYSQFGLQELLEKDKIGSVVRPMGTPLGTLTGRSAMELGLERETVVGVGIIDAHAGGLGVLGAALGGRNNSIENIMCLIGGTSSCHMVVSRKPVFVPGVWGPYYSAMVPGMWLTEGGQSATGALVDFVLKTNSLYGEVKSQLKGMTIYQFLNRRLDILLRKDRFLTENIHVLPYFHGNRSPRANPDLKGCISGLTLNNTIDTYAALYLAVLQSIACGTKHIIDEMNKSGHKIKVIAACGGGTKNPYFLQQHADITGCRIYLPKEEESVLLGTAILAACARGKFSGILEACREMSAQGDVITPDSSRRNFNDRKYEVFRRMYGHQKEYAEIMKGK